MSQFCCALITRISCTTCHPITMQILYSSCSTHNTNERHTYMRTLRLLCMLSHALLAGASAHIRCLPIPCPFCFLRLSLALSCFFSRSLSLSQSLSRLSFPRSLLLCLSLAPLFFRSQSFLFSHPPLFSSIFQILRKSVPCPSHSLFSLLARPLACPRSSSLPSPTPTLSHSFARLPSAYKQLLLPLPCLIRSPLPLLLCPPAGKLPRYVCVVVVCVSVCVRAWERESE